ncbi:MAG TPA: hypothetical protein VIP11_21170 [Gemmatimonadaceae bacterium]
MTLSSVRRAARLLGAIALLVGVAPVLPAQVHITLRAWTQPVMMDTLRQDHHLRASPAQVYEAALKAFGQLDLPTGRTDGTRGIIGSERFERQRVLLGLPMSRSFNCGETVTGPNADSFRLEIAIVVWVADDKPGTKLSLASVASGRDVTGVARAPKECASTGTVETKLLEAITKIVGG